MGVKHFFIWLRKNFPETIREIKHGENFKTHDVGIDNLCLDMNGIFHTCAQKIYQYGSFEKKSLLRKPQYKRGLRWQMRLYESVCEAIENYRELVKPKKRLILCVDGVAGRAKMNQQRQRRYRSEKLENCDFDTSSITPGTKFMDHLSRYIEWYIRVMVTNSSDWQDLEIVYSGHNVNGEGEHKIINYIRHNPNQGESYCIHGLDADLIMLSLATRSKSMYVLRENIRNISELHLIDIGKLSTRLAFHLKWDRDEVLRDVDKNNNESNSSESNSSESTSSESNSSESNSSESNSSEPKKTIEKFSQNNAIDDFIFMCFLVGNDFVPNIPTLAILDGGIESMIDVYQNVGRSYGHLTRISRKARDTTVMFRQKALSVFLGTLAQYEAGLLEEKFNGHSNFIEDPLLTASMGPVQEKDGELKQLIDFEKYKRSYYTKKFDEKNIQDVCENYLRGLQWVMTYYKKGMPDWNWYYPEFYAPFLCDLARCCEKSKMIESQEVFTLNNPVSPFLQLLCVLPPRCSHLLPQQLSYLLSSESSPLKEFIPETVNVDCSGKRQEWEGIVILPNVNLDIVQREYDKNYSNVSEQDKRRNIIRQSISFTYDTSSRNYLFKSFYGDIENCKAKYQYFDI
jgi:5'-3' exonuclease